MKFLSKIKQKLPIFKHKDVNIIRNGNNTIVEITGNISVIINGELEIITKDNKICFDSLNSELHLNSRVGRILSKLPESIEYQEHQQQLIKKNNQCAIAKDYELYDLIGDLYKTVKEKYDARDS